MRALHESAATPTYNSNFEQCSPRIRQNAMGCQVQQLTSQYVRRNKSRCAERAFPVVDQISTHLKHISCRGRAMSFIDNHGYSALARWLCPPCQQTLNHVRPRSLRHIRPPLDCHPERSEGSRCAQHIRPPDCHPERSEGSRCAQAYTTSSDSFRSAASTIAKSAPQGTTIMFLSCS